MSLAPVRALSAAEDQEVPREAWEMSFMRAAVVWPAKRARSIREGVVEEVPEQVVQAPTQHPTWVQPL